ncbi:MAG: flippase-like domain-containing protein [Candidatus Bipolaricaulota bacterium]|nr:flippase-like domain-containing protein [Candidatus Bipolaricaulota bacterium]
MGRVWLAVALVGVGLGLFALILVLVGPAAVWAQLQALGLGGFLALVGNDLAATLLWVASWGVLLHAFGTRLPPTQTFGIGVAGFAVSYITPVAYVGGEPVRAWLVAKKSGTSLTTAFATLFVDRLLAGLSLVLFALLGGAFTLTGDLLPPTARIQVALGLFILALAVTLGVLSFARNYHWLSRLVTSLGRLHRAWTWPGVWGRRIRAMEDEMHRAFTRLLPWTALAFLLQLASFFCTYLRPALFFFFTEGRRFSLPDLAVYFNLNAILTTLLWLTPAGLGTAEGGRVGILALLGISPQGGMAFSLTVRFLELLLVGAGLLYLSREGLLRVRAGALRPRAVASWARSALGFLRGTLEVGLLGLWAVIPARARGRLFARRFRTPDPWGYAESPYERRKYELKLAILPRRPDPAAPPYGRVLELGCAEGLFTCALARAGVGREIVGVDFAPQALERARARCPFPGVEFLLLDITAALPPGEFDLVYCSEVLYYLGSRRRIRELADRLCAKLRPGGHVVLVGPWPAERAFHRPFTAHPELRVVARRVERGLLRPYAVTCLEKRGRREEKTG